MKKDKIKEIILKSLYKNSLWEHIQTYEGVIADEIIESLCAENAVLIDDFTEMDFSNLPNVKNKVPEIYDVFWFENDRIDGEFIVSNLVGNHVHLFSTNPSKDEFPISIHIVEFLTLDGVSFRGSSMSRLSKTNKKEKIISDIQKLLDKLRLSN